MIRHPETDVIGDVTMLRGYGFMQRFLPDMLAADWPCAVVSTGSKQGITLPPGDTAYAAAFVDTVRPCLSIARPPG